MVASGVGRLAVIGVAQVGVRERERFGASMKSSIVVPVKYRLFVAWVNCDPSTRTTLCADAYPASFVSAQATQE